MELPKAPIGLNRIFAEPRRTANSLEAFETQDAWNEGAFRVCKDKNLLETSPLSKRRRQKRVLATNLMISLPFSETRISSA